MLLPWINLTRDLILEKGSGTTTGLHDTHYLWLNSLSLFLPRFAGFIWGWACLLQQGLSRTVSLVPHLTSQELWCSSWKIVKFHSMYDVFITSSSSYILQCVCGACVWESLIQCLMKNASAPSPALPPSLFLRVSGSWIMKHDLCRLPGDHRWGGKADNRRPSVQCKQMQLVHSAACPSAPVQQGWCEVKRMVYWTGCSCTLTGVNINTLKAT